MLFTYYLFEAYLADTSSQLITLKNAATFVLQMLFTYYLFEAYLADTSSQLITLKNAAT